MDIVSGTDLAPVARRDLSAATDMFGAPFLTVHRVNLHTELMRPANVSQGRIEFVDGTVKHADVIVGADGLRSAVRSAVIRDPRHAELLSTGFRAFRFLVPTDKARSDSHDARGTVQNVVGIHPSTESATDAHEQMVRQFEHYDQNLVQLLRNSKDTNCLPLPFMKPLSSWTFGKVVLIGDTAHPERDHVE
ncbi:hypothetical protein G6O67_006167 [Ophiocordyceps sinensis]|uniref:FAD-binding domain-containing protein n=1 Tax=Ophiocordyceps sinensis TaxID=72228 RepID=A0A8H4LVD9_9HYPO|nr:hypothetical protein G6O67_006167 [Ophiocordyceps sinensis]